MSRLLLLIILFSSGAGQHYDHYLRAVWYELAGDTGSALKEYWGANLSSPGSPQILEAFSTLLYKAGAHRVAGYYSRQLTRLAPQNPNGYALLGNCELELGRIGQGLSLFQRRLELKADDEFLISVARVYDELGYWAEALELYRILIERNPEGLEHLELGARAAANIRDYPIAVHLYRTAVEVDSAEINAWLGLGYCLEAQGELSEAASAYERAIWLNPRVITARRRLLDIYLRLERWAEAESLGIQLLNQCPFEPEVHRNLGYLYYRTRAPARAVHHFLITLGLKPRDAYSLLYLGRICKDQKDYDRAQDYFTRAVRADPSFSPGWTYLGLLNLELNRPPQAIREFKQALRRGEKTCQSYYLLARAYDAASNPRAAITYYLKALELQPDNPDLHYRLGVLYDQLNRPDEAIQEFRQVLVLDTTYAPAYNYLGYLYAERGENLTEAESLIKQALSSDPNNGYFHDSLGWVYFKLGRYAQALEELERAAELIEDPIIYEHLGDLHYRMGNLNEAQQHWQRALRLDPQNRGLKRRLKEIE